MNEEGKEDPTSVDRWSQALSWHVILCEMDEKELASSLARKWQDWYADAKNRRVFDNVSRLLADRGHYRKRCRPAKAELEVDSYDLSGPITEWHRARARKKSRNFGSSGRKWQWWLSGGIAVAAIAVLIILWPHSFRLGGDSGRIVYQTQVGGLKAVYLPDGSSIILGGRTELSVALSTQRRSVNLIEGQAWFRVAHDPHWPFVVTAGDGSITDIGTAFLVTRDSDRVVVTVTEGAVTVSARQPVRLSYTFDRGPVIKPRLAPIRLGRGEQLALSDTGALGPLTQADMRAATAWTSGRLTFDNQPLRYVIEAVNRYSSRRIVVSPSAGVLRFSGIVFDDEISDWLQSLEVIFPVTIEERGDDVRIYLRSKPTPRKLPFRTQP